MDTLTSTATPRWATAALIARDGRVDWLPVPRLDSAPVFAALLDADQGGYISLRPTRPFAVHRRLLPGTDVLETTFTTDTGTATVTDALTSVERGSGEVTELVRRIEGTQGDVEFEAQVVPGTVWHTASPQVSMDGSAALIRVGGIAVSVRTWGAQPYDVWPDRVGCSFLASEGSSHLLVIHSQLDAPATSDADPAPTTRTAPTACDRPAPETDPDPTPHGLVHTEEPKAILERLSDTVIKRQAWSASLRYEGPHRAEVITSALILRQLMRFPEGSVAAAATTSQPESLTQAKNWDYRLFWLRDAALALGALYQVGSDQEAHAALRAMLPLVRRFAQRHTVLAALDVSDPGSTVQEHDVPGWRGHRPVVTGNRATEQLQLSVYGDILAIFAHGVEHGYPLNVDTAQLLTTLADQAASSWRLPDSGIWEVPQERQFTTSKLGCWQALDQAVRLHEADHLAGDAVRWRTAMEDIRAWVNADAWSAELGAYEFYPGSGQVDASILLHAISGFDRGERMRSTLRVLQAQVGAGPHLHRYSGAEEEEGAFTACSFWMVCALALTGDRASAHTRMDALVRACPNDVGVMSETIDPESGAALGNLPQALSHLALIQAAATLEAKDGAE